MGGSTREQHYLHLPVKSIITLIAFAVLFSCSLESPAPAHIEADAALENIHTWEIDNPGLLPYPRYSGVLEDQSLIIVDWSLNTINHLDADGNLIKTISGTGRGPGEFSGITHASVNPDGRIAVADIGNARFTVLDVFDRTIVSGDLDNGWHTRVSWVADGLVISNNPFRIGAANPGAGDILMRLYDPETGVKEEFML